MMNKSMSGAGGRLYAGFKNRQVVSARAEKMERGGREEIFVFSLKHGTGTSYLSAGIANYIAMRNKNVSLVLEDTEFIEEIVGSKVMASSWGEDNERLYSLSDYIVYDGGVFDEMSSEKNALLTRSTIKVIVCNGDGWYLQKLAEFEESRRSGEMVYLFNNIPKEWEGKVYSVMDFSDNVFIMPSFYAKGIVSPAEEIFRQILKRR